MPAATVEATVMVMVDVLEPGVNDVGLKPTLTPVGWPDAVSETEAVKPFSALPLMVDVPLFEPCNMLTVAGEAESVNVGEVVAERAR